MKNANFWIASEVCHTAAHSRKTLYVSGKHAVDTILRHASTNGVNHISFGRGGLDVSDSYYRDTVAALSSAGYTLTIEYPVANHSEMVAYFGLGVFTARNVIPLAILDDAGVMDGDSNFTLAVDDRAAGGRWCAGPGDIKDSNKFTLHSELDPKLAIVLDPVVGETAVETRRVQAIEDGGLAPEEVNNTVETSLTSQQLAVETSKVAEVESHSEVPDAEPTAEAVPADTQTEEPVTEADDAAVSEAAPKRKRGGANAE